MARAKTRQREMSFGRGGWRPGAGRPCSKRRDKRVLHRKRPRVTGRTPVHLTVRMRSHVANLRTKRRARVIREALVACCKREGFRIVDWSIQGNHLHLIAEAGGNPQLARSMQAFCIRVARGLNRLAERAGPVFRERYHVHVLTTPAEVRNARAYVLNNFRHHATQTGRRVRSGWVDPFTSWAYFDGWRDLPKTLVCDAAVQRRRPPEVVVPRSWLLRVGWRRRGLIGTGGVPAARALTTLRGASA